MKPSKFLLLLPFLLLTPFVPGQDDESENTPKKTLDEILLTDALWNSSLGDIKDHYKPKEGESNGANVEGLPKELIAQLKAQGFDLGELQQSGGTFDWLSSQKQGLRSPGGVFTLLDKEVGEVVIRSNGDTVGSVSISIFNRGDDGTMPKSEFLSLLGDWKSSLDTKLAVRPQSRDETGVVAIQGWMWRKDNTAYLLEGSITRRENRAEFLRLRMAPLNGRMNAPKAKVTRRGDLDENVTKTAEGDVMIKGIPMVDQGDKGYCVVATVERVARYYGLQVDQHELAQVANTDRYGTSGTDMEEAFKKLTGKIHARTLKLIDYDDRQFERDYTSYNRAAKREGVFVFEEDLDEWIIDPRYFWAKADKDVFKKVKAEQNKCDFFFGKIEEYIDQGIPICWSLYLGMFEEEDSPQMYGGHMRMIYGYNKEKKEIIYTDSWGEGHALKRMPADEAWCMTMGIYVTLPNR